VPDEDRKPAAWRIARIAAALAGLALVAAAWRWTPLHEWISLGSLVHALRRTADSPWAFAAVFGVYVLAGWLMVPLSLLIIATAVTFGPLLGAVCAVGGALASAAATYGLGRAIGRDLVRRLVGDRLNRITRRLSRKGVLAIVLMRMLPFAAFSRVNLAAGASHVRLADFLLGTALGIVPAVALTVVFIDRVEAAVMRPDAWTFASLAAIVAVLAASTLFVWRRFGNAAPALDDVPRGAQRAEQSLQRMRTK
jgi:uncharacterized membrane protein YdjX (TVP38/TMEM64 family)